MPSFLGVPIRGRRAGVRQPVPHREARRRAFTDADEELVVTLAAAAGIAIDHAELRVDAAAVALVDERVRIARDLHDDVIQRLFAAGLTLQSIAGRAGNERLAEQLNRTVDDLDATIRQVRAAIFDLRPPTGRARACAPMCCGSAATPPTRSASSRPAGSSGRSTARCRRRRRPPVADAARGTLQRRPPRGGEACRGRGTASKAG